MKKYYGYYESPIGVIEIIGSDKEIFFVHFVNKKTKEDSDSLIIKETISQLDEYFKGKRREFNIKVKLGGTEFQKSCWNELIKIPYGETRSYKEIAEGIKNPNAVRAVGGANNKNPIAIIIPCHRVIGKNGKMVGYAGGIDKKIWLLKHEKSELPNNN